MLLKVFESVASALENGFAETQDVSHPGVKGGDREDLLSRQLREYLPERYSIGSGIFVDTLGNQSPQQDLVVYDRFSIPTIRSLDQSQVFFLEQVLACIEVKSNLGTREIDDILSKTEKMRGMGPPKRRDGGSEVSISQHRQYPLPVLSFAYRSRFSLERIHEKFTDSLSSDPDKLRWPNAVCVLSDKEDQAGVVLCVHEIFMNSQMPFPTDESTLAIYALKSKGQAVLCFYLLLMEILQTLQPITSAPDYLAYAQAAGLGRQAMLSTGQQETRLYHASQVAARSNLHEDKEVLDALYLTMVAVNSAIELDTFSANTRYQLDDELVSEPTPFMIKAALEQRASGTVSAKNIQILESFLRLMRSAHSRGKCVLTINPETKKIVGALGNLQGV